MAELQLTEAAPNITIGGIDLQNGAQVLYSSREGILGAQDTCDPLHGWDRPLVELQSLLVALHGTVVVLHLLRERACCMLEPLHVMRNAPWLTHLSPDGLSQLAQVLRRSLVLVRVRWMPIDLRVRRMLAYVMWRHARGGRGLLVLGHDGFLRPSWLQCDARYRSRSGDGMVAGEPQRKQLSTDTA
jgi:hypothetical protein